MARFSERVELRVSPDMYAALLQEAGGEPRRVPDVVREKLTSALLDADEVRKIKAGQTVILELMKQLLLDQAPVLARMQGVMANLSPERQKEELDRIEKLLAKKLGLVEKVLRDAGS
jgi:hypothetical protein